MAIKIKLEGFDDLLEKLEKSDGAIERACDGAIRQSAQIMQQELKSQMASTMVGGARLGSRMPMPEIKNSGNVFYAKVGFKSTPYTPRNLSDYHKAVFANFGTGHEDPRQFVNTAKKNARPRIKKAQKEVFEKILQRLKK